jgi:hypothetical protein
MQFMHDFIIGQEQMSANRSIYNGHPAPVCLEQKIFYRGVLHRVIACINSGTEAASE